MKPTLNMLPDDLIQQILDEAKRILSEIGMEIRGTEMRQRLLGYGLKADGERPLPPIPPHIVKSTPQTGSTRRRRRRRRQPPA